ncbi:MAG: TonB-dependent receptor [Saprospiraceae bacterium]|nr:TonB-dependent receptor [Saprospiraceae bacterium]
MNHLYWTGVLCLALAGATAQTESDTLKLAQLDAIMVSAPRLELDTDHLPEVQGTYIFSGKKSEVISLTARPAALTEKYARQVFAKVPGIFVYDMDGTGNQMNIATRGLDPHRGWEFNIRKDGVITNSDMYGYPASHYNIPMEAVDRIELVRGTGSLQYGAQFGGMLNYVTKKPDTARWVSFESIHTVGSYGLVSTYNALSGGKGPFRYSAWMNRKHNGGYRTSGDSDYQAHGISLYWDPSAEWSLVLDWTRSDYTIHLAGPLTDAQFDADPQMATRHRNYYNPDIHVPSLTVNWKPRPHTTVSAVLSAILGERNSVQFDKPATVPDTLVTATGTYNPRQVDIDRYRSLTAEVRILQEWHLFGRRANLAAGIQVMDNDLHRRQQGKGTTGIDYTLDLTEPGWGRDLHYLTANLAAFVENRVEVTPRLSVQVGARIENGRTDMKGTTVYYDDKDLPNTIDHRFPLFGAGAQYELTKRINLYGGWSQAYRPVLFKDIVPASIYEVADKDLQDAYGDNLELGFRGKWRFLSWDVTGYMIHYRNRMGTLAETDANGDLLIRRTNIGDSETRGVEAFLQGDWVLGPKTSLQLFTSTAWTDARYRNAVVRSGTENVSIDGNHVESTPAWISRNGASMTCGRWKLSALYSYTAESFADPQNTVAASASGAVGLVPAYHLVDAHVCYRLNDHIRLQVNANNLFDVSYFTKRPQFYSGPDIRPSDGRSLPATVTVNL